MTKETTYSGILGEMQRFHASMAASIAEIPHLELAHARFGEILSRARDVAVRQAALIAEKQELSLQLKAAISDCQRLATMLRQGLKQHYGIRSEKLAEYGLPPFRGRKLKAKPEPEEPETPTPTPAEKPATTTTE